MVKLVIQIPCYNEERTLPKVLEEIPERIVGIDEIEVQIVDDGSTDRTVEIARSYGCRVVSYVGNKGLGVAFKKGIEEALKRGADILVNTDGDNQYPGRYIPFLIKPVLMGRADIVIGNRRVSKICHFSPVKKFFQWFGSMTARWLSGTGVRDTVSGFRAYSREALLELNVISKFSYVLDTIVQAGKKGLKIVNIPIKVNRPTRPSRLFKGIFEHVRKSGANLVRVYVMYEPFKVFVYVSSFFVAVGGFLVLRFFYRYLVFGGEGLIQSLIIAAIFILTGLGFFGIGILADLIAINRKLIEEGLYLQKKFGYRNRNKRNEVKGEDLNNGNGLRRRI